MTGQDRASTRHMPTATQVSAITLRSLLVTILLAHGGPCSVAQLTNALAAHGVVTKGRPSKAISDALRWEISRGRVRRVGRGAYVASVVPRTTAWRMRQRSATAVLHGEPNRSHAGSPSRGADATDRR